MTGFASMLGAILSALVYVRVLYPLRMISVNQVRIGTLIIISLPSRVSKYLV